jgi:hypothetical protein
MCDIFANPSTNICTSKIFSKEGYQENSLTSLILLRKFLNAFVSMTEE